MSNRQHMFACFLSPHKAGEQFTRWPLHITIIPWFGLKLPEVDFIKESRQIVRHVDPFEVKVSTPLPWTFNKVNPVEPRDELYVVHNALLDIVRRDADMKAPFKFIGKCYRPHITHKQGLSVEEGSVVPINSFSLIAADSTMSKHARPKEIIANITLGKH